MSKKSKIYRYAETRWHGVPGSARRHGADGVSVMTGSRRDVAAGHPDYRCRIYCGTLTEIAAEMDAVAK